MLIAGKFSKLARKLKFAYDSPTFGDWRDQHVLTPFGFFAVYELSLLRPSKDV